MTKLVCDRCGQDIFDAREAVDVTIRVDRRWTEGVDSWELEVCNTCAYRLKDWLQRVSEPNECARPCRRKLGGEHDDRRGD